MGQFNYRPQVPPFLPFATQQQQQMWYRPNNGNFNLGTPSIGVQPIFRPRSEGNRVSIHHVSSDK